MRCGCRGGVARACERRPAALRRDERRGCLYVLRRQCTLFLCDDATTLLRAQSSCAGQRGWGDSASKPCGRRRARNFGRGGLGRRPRRSLRSVARRPTILMPPILGLSLEGFASFMQECLGQPEAPLPWHVRAWREVVRVCKKTCNGRGANVVDEVLAELDERRARCVDKEYCMGRARLRLAGVTTNDLKDTVLKPFRYCRTCGPTCVVARGAAQSERERARGHG